MSPRAELDDEHLETIRELAAAPDRPEAEVTEITLRAALAETVAELDRLRAPPAGGFELRGFSPGPGATWERIAHPGDRRRSAEAPPKASPTENSPALLAVFKCDRRPENARFAADAGAAAEAFGAQRNANIAGDPSAETWVFRLSPTHAAMIEVALASLVATLPDELPPKASPPWGLEGGELAALAAVIRDQREIDDRTSADGVPVEAPRGHVAIRLVDRELDLLDAALTALLSVPVMVHADATVRGVHFKADVVGRTIYQNPLYPVVHPDLVSFDLRRPYGEWPETVRALIEQRQRQSEGGDGPAGDGVPR